MGRCNPFEARLLAAAAAIAVASGCAALLDIDEVDCDPNAPACQSTPGTLGPMGTLPGTESTCDSFCRNASAICHGAEAAYTTEVICRGVCEFYDEEELSCRLRELELARDLGEPSTHCPAASIAGSRGDGQLACSTACFTYCKILATACPNAFDATAVNAKNLETYADSAACLASCERMPDSSRGFSVQDRAGDTVQCRLWHLAQATIDPLHCEHARGDCPCGDDEKCLATLPPPSP